MRQDSSKNNDSKGRPENSFAIMPDLRRRFPRPSTKWLWLWKVRYFLKARWRQIRIQRWVTALLGPQYQRSRNLIEIDITYLCNLHCLNCNRSVTQARESKHMATEMITRFVDESLQQEKFWRRIRVLGGEPTLHPQFTLIIDELLRYRARYPETIIEVVTNGYGQRVKRTLANLPSEVMVDNSNKDSPIQPSFGPFNLAPRDDPQFRNSSYTNGCAVLEECGMGLTPMGYYPCAVAGGIDRILESNLGLDHLPDDTDDMLEATNSLCQLCGRFRDGHFIPRALRPPLDDAPVSDSWKSLYDQWHQRKADQSPADKDTH